MESIQMNQAPQTDEMEKMEAPLTHAEKERAGEKAVAEAYRPLSQQPFSEPGIERAVKNLYLQPFLERN